MEQVSKPGVIFTVALSLGMVKLAHDATQRALTGNTWLFFSVVKIVSASTYFAVGYKASEMFEFNYRPFLLLQSAVMALTIVPEEEKGIIMMLALLGLMSLK